MTTYRRLDDGLTPGYASINEVSRLLISESSSGVVRPPEESIHRIENPFREVAMTLHVFVAGGEEPSVFDPRAKTLIPAGAEAHLAGV